MSGECPKERSHRYSEKLGRYPKNQALSTSENILLKILGRKYLRDVARAYFLAPKTWLDR